MADHINDRKVNEGSTSRYIQQRIPNENGIPSIQVSSVSDTPDQSILNSLIVITQTVINFTKSTIQGAIASLSGSNVEKKIKEIAPTPEKANYGEIQVQETSGGHVIIVDDTTGNKRLITQHANGSYDSMVDNGDRSEKTTKDSYTFIKRDMIVHVDRDSIKIVSGNSSIEIKGDSFTNVAGNSNENVVSDKKTKVGGSSIVDTTRDISQVAGGGIGSQCGGDRDEITGGNDTKMIQGNLSITATGNVTLLSSSLVTITAPMISLN